MKTLVTFFLLLIGFQPGYPQSGELDHSFAGKGFVVEKFIPVNVDNEKVLKVFANQDGTYIAVIVGDRGTHELAKFFPDGSLDTAFGENGFVFLNMSRITTASQQVDGKVLVAGESYDNTVMGNTAFYLSRYNPDGSLDHSFSNDGKVIIGFRILSISVQDLKKIFVSGLANLERLNMNGTLDSTFAHNGILTYSFGNENEAYSINVQDDGRIFVAGTLVVITPAECDKCDPGEYIRSIVLCLNSDGTKNINFGDNGEMTPGLHFDEFIGTDANEHSGLEPSSILSVQSDGKIVLIGVVNNGSDFDVRLERYTANGLPDVTFNSNGAQTTDFGSNDFPTSIIIQSDGKTVVTVQTRGAYVDNTNNFVVARYDINGSLDRTFDGDGKVETDFGSNDFANCAAVLKNGKIVVAGGTTSATNFDFAFASYNGDGSTDNDFSSDGKIIGYVPLGIGELNSIAIQKDGKKVVAGNIIDSINRYNFFVSRYNLDGKPDKTFNVDGNQFTDFGYRYSISSALAIQDDGKIIVAGVVFIQGNDYFAIARYNADGSHDSTFSEDGRQISYFNYRYYASEITSVLIQKDGKIIVGGTVIDFAFNFDFAIARYNSDGTLDSSFGSDGLKITDFSASDDVLRAMALQNDGSIIAVGRTYSNGKGSFALARYKPNGSLDISFDVDGRQTTDISNNDEASSVVIQPDNKILVGGGSSLSRYNTNGSLDTTFDRDGKLSIPFVCFDLVIQNDRKIVTIGAVFNSNFVGDLAIARLNSNGTYDSTFSSDGRLIADLGGNERADAGAIYNNKLYVAGSNIIAAFNLGDNIAPAIYLSAPVKDTIFTSPANIDLNASASDSDGVINYVQFYNGNTIVKTDSISPYSYTMTNVPAGSYSFVAKAADNNGARSSSASVAVTVAAAPNKAPVVKITSPGNNKTYTAPGTITLTAAASDSDGTITRVQFYNGGTRLAIDSTSPYSFTLTNVAAGSYSFIALATDNKGLSTSSASVPVSVSVTSNKAPVIRLTALANNGVYFAPSGITLNASASDSDGVISYVQFYNGGTVVNTDSTSPYTYTMTNVAAGTYSFVAKAADNKGLRSSSASVSVNVLAPSNKAPVVNVNSPGNNAVFYAGGSIPLNAAASDPDGTITKVQFYNGGTRLAIDSISPYSFTLVNAAPGNYSFIALATDNKGLSTSSASVPVLVKANKKPLIEIVAPAGNSIYTAPAAITIDAEASDSDGIISYVDFYSGTTLLKRDSTSPYSFTWNNVAAGTYQLTAKASDDHGLETTSSTVPVTVSTNASLEAEDAVLSGAVIASVQPGFIGSGYADYVNASGDFIEWTINAPSAGAYSLKFRYANGSNANRPLKLQVNGVIVNASLDFLPTGAWSTWSFSTAAVTLTSGLNKIRLTTIGVNGANVDNVALIANTGSLEAEEAVLSGAVVASVKPGFTGTGYADYVNASGDYIEWTADIAFAGSYTLNFRYANGSNMNRPLKLEINGSVVKAGLDFLPTTNWGTWSLSSVTATLIAGANKIRLTTIGANGANVDNVAIIANTGTLEAEEAVLSGAVIASVKPGFTGSGYADYVNNSGDYIEWTANVTSAGTYALNFRYANGSNANHPLKLEVNGVVVDATFDFLPTGGWDKWSLASVTVSLNAGENKIKLTTTGLNGPNVDNLSIGTNNQVQSFQRSTTGKSAMYESANFLRAEVSPNPAAGNARLNIFTSSNLPVKIHMFDILGRVHEVSFIYKNPGLVDFSVKSLASGSYIILVKQGNLQTHVKLIVGK